MQEAGIPCRIGNSIPTCFLPQFEESAKAGYELCNISTNGSLRPDNLTQLSFGNILRQEDIANIWQSGIASAYRTSVNTTCLRCHAFNTCRGGSKSLQWEYMLSGDPLMTGVVEWDDPKPISDPKTDELIALTSD